LSKVLAAVRGMHDITPEKTTAWQSLEKILQKTATKFGYNEVRTPIVEHSELFLRSIGAETDIVTKEMYAFEDRNGDKLTLRPEGTASCVRLAIKHDLLRSPGEKIWYNGPMFRHERPQKGRYRQFHQFGVEVFGLATTSIEVELISLCHNIWSQLNIANKVQLELNHLGSKQDREQYKIALVDYFKEHENLLSEDELQRLQLNPLRILDSKNKVIGDLLIKAPKLADFLSDSAVNEFKALCLELDNIGIVYKINPFLVRGLDYYSALVFEWKTAELGAQDTICAGGRYDDLVANLGSINTPAIGFALGMERLISLSTHNPLLKEQPLSYIIALSENTDSEANKIAHLIRTETNAICLQDHIGGSAKNKFKRAAKSQAKIAIIIGDDELKNNNITIKYLQQEQPQTVIKVTELIPFITSIGAKENESL
jgi:histidyl-tRNA synthetase